MTQKRIIGECVDCKQHKPYMINAQRRCSSCYNKIRNSKQPLITCPQCKQTKKKYLKVICYKCYEDNRLEKRKLIRIEHQLKGLPPPSFDKKPPYALRYDTPEKKEQKLAKERMRWERKQKHYRNLSKFFEYHFGIKLSAEVINEKKEQLQKIKTEVQKENDKNNARTKRVNAIETQLLKGLVKDTRNY